MKKDLKKNIDNLPIATEILKDYKKINKRLFIVIGVMLTIFVLETAYLILLLDSLNNSVGLIREEIHEIEEDNR